MLGAVREKGGSGAVWGRSRRRGGPGGGPVGSGPGGGDLTRCPRCPGEAGPWVGGPGEGGLGVWNKGVLGLGGPWQGCAVLDREGSRARRPAPKINVPSATKLA